MSTLNNLIEYLERLQNTSGFDYSELGEWLQDNSKDILEYLYDLDKISSENDLTKTMTLDNYKDYLLEYKDSITFANYIPEVVNTKDLWVWYDKVTGNFDWEDQWAIFFPKLLPNVDWESVHIDFEDWFDNNYFSEQQDKINELVEKYKRSK